MALGVEENRSAGKHPGDFFCLMITLNIFNHSRVGVISHILMQPSRKRGGEIS